MGYRAGGAAKRTRYPWPTRARSSVEERRPSKPLVGGSNPPGRMNAGRTSGSSGSPLRHRSAVAQAERLASGGSPLGRVLRTSLATAPDTSGEVADQGLAAPV